ncbi:MAG: response regulator [Deltaproteobacteria bacterium]|nr:response regulator [Deltaproteobacteria bacterium]
MVEETHVLIVEDLPTDAELAEREIKKELGHCEFRRVETREEFLRALEDFRPNLIVCDYLLPSFDGMTALKIAKERIPDVPFIILTGSMNEDTAVTCMKAGAWDYVIKEHVKRLGSAVLSALEQQRLLFEQRETEKQRKSLEDQLRQSQRLESVGRLAGGVAHDFNNLLTTITGNAQIGLMDLNRDEPLYEILKEIKDAGERAARLTRQLLAFSRKQILQPEILNLNQVVEEMDKMLVRLIGEPVELKTLLAPDLGLVKADPGQLEQVVMNLAVNARDAMPQGGKLTIETANVELDPVYAKKHGDVVTPGSHVMLAVSDTGTGMSPETQAQVFEPFFTTKEMGVGTGLGLSMVYGIVKQSNGYIWVYSEPDKGTTFKIYLPRVETGTVDRQAEKPDFEDLQGSETILVVEDEASVRNIARKVLSRYGYTVLMAGNAEEALEVFGKHKRAVHLLLTDVVMPGRSGKKLAEKLQKQKPGLRVLFMSGYTDNSVVRNGALEEGIPFIQKPFAPDSLARKVKTLLMEQN